MGFLVAARTSRSVRKGCLVDTKIPMMCKLTLKKAIKLKYKM